MKVSQKFPRLQSVQRVRDLHFRFAKLTPFAFIALFLAINFTGLMSHVLAPAAEAAATEVEIIPLDIPVSGDCDLDWIIFRAGEREGVDPRFIHAVIKQESQYKARAVSPVGARGLMQLMPATAKRFGSTDINDTASNVEAGTKYLAYLLKRFDGDVSLALAGYNAGEGAVDKYKGIPPYPETQSYVSKIVSDYGKSYHPVLSPEDAKSVFHLIAAN
ncbi:MAG TPA: lytic transglycosylase domain-containing protein [Pyrinomonadaceae bacterium]|nr:lytic transglycosylase domain-containing protein [Pyrinomonadaceae bacterium]